MPQFQRVWATHPTLAQALRAFNIWSIYPSSWRAWGSSRQLQKISYLPWGDLKGFVSLLVCK